MSIDITVLMEVLGRLEGEWSGSGKEEQECATHLNPQRYIEGVWERNLGASGETVSSEGSIFFYIKKFNTVFGEEI